jgi:hypothetical protein
MKAIILRLELEVYEVLQRLAEQSRRSINSELRILIEEEAKRREEAKVA